MGKKIKAGIIGGKGRMGDWFRNFLLKNNFDVIVSDINGGLTNKELVEQSDAVIFSVPIGKTVDVIEETLPFTKPDQILLDLTSIKTPAVNAMLKSDCEVLGLHPMFSHHTNSIKGQTVILCKSRPKEYTGIFEEMFIKSGARVKISTPEDHDKIMATIQGLTHFNAIVLASALMKLGVDINESLNYTSPIYKIRMDMIGRIMAQDPRLYAEIETLNPYTIESVKELIGSAHELFKHIEKKDVEGFIEYFKKASLYIGNFRDTAMEESNYLIKKMTEKENNGRLMK